MSHNNQRLVIDVRLTPPAVTVRRSRRQADLRNELLDDVSVETMQRRVEDLVLFAHNEYRRLHAGRFRNWQWNMSVVLNGPEDMQLVRPSWAVSLNRQQMRQFNRGRAGRRQGNRFRTADEIATQFGPAFVMSMENMSQSERSIGWNDVEITLQFDAVANLARGTSNKLKGYVRKTIMFELQENTPGLYKYKSVGDDLCGYQAIAFALCLSNRHIYNNWAGDKSWLDQAFANPSKKSWLDRLDKSAKLFRTISEHVRTDVLQMRGPWVVSRTDGLSTAAKFVEKQPKLQLIIYDQQTRQPMEQRVGVAFDPDKSDECTIAMTWSFGHVQLIRSLRTYTGRAKDPTYKYCFNCLEFKKPIHECKAFFYCDKCKMKYRTKKALKKHGNGSVECENCGLLCVSQNCLVAHMVNCKPFDDDDDDAAAADTVRPQRTHYKCKQCDKQVLYDSNHRCYIEAEEEVEPRTAEQHCENYYAFDFESQLVDVAEKVKAHHVNLIVLKRCFSPDGVHYVFRTLDAFVSWIDELPQPVTMFAHNLMGYDGRMLFDYLFEHRTPPVDMTWRGSKIMSMTYGKATFRDTLLHWPTSLEKLPAMFGLDENKYKKGFFPYEFNTPENAQYVGPMPAEEYFHPEYMSGAKRARFDQWYSDMVAQNYVYDFDKEMIEYCISDVEILTHSICMYVKSMIEVKPLNPLSCLTIASYAMKMYRMYFMPESVKIPRLNKKEHDKLMGAMFGGRTDARCLLKEYTEEELAQGIHGAYQDVQSLYPTVQFYDPMPVGDPQWVYFGSADPQPSLDEVRSVFGFVCCDIRCTRYLHHPIIVDVDHNTHRLLATLEPKTNIVVCTPELQLALDNGYVIDKVHWWCAFDQSTDLFKSYIRTFLKRKVEATGMKSVYNDAEIWREFTEYHERELGVTIERENMVSNPAQRSGMKLLLNSLWGKFGQRTRNSKWKMFRKGNKDEEAVYALENSWINGDLDIHFRKYSASGDRIAMLFSYVDESPFVKRAPHSNIAVAAMVTSHARCRLWKMLNKIGNRVLYHDTDSIIYTTAGYGREDEDIPTGKYLGEWEDELGGGHITKFVSTGPKCYSYVTNTGKGACKVKGITLHSQNAQAIHYESMKRLVTKSIDEIHADAVMFKHDRDVGVMVTESVQKVFRVTYGKGELSTQENNYSTYPFGWENFISSI